MSCSSLQPQLVPPQHTHTSILTHTSTITLPTHFYRDLKMENILLDKKKRNVKLVGKHSSQSYHWTQIGQVPQLLPSLLLHWYFYTPFPHPIPPPPPSLPSSIPPHTLPLPHSLHLLSPSFSLFYSKTLAWVMPRSLEASCRPTVAVRSMLLLSCSSRAGSMGQRWMSGACESVGHCSSSCMTV